MPSTDQRHSQRPFRARLTSLLVAVAALGLGGCQSMFPPLLVESDASGALRITLHAATWPDPDETTLRVELYRKPKPTANDTPIMYQEVAWAELDKGIAFAHIAVGTWYVRVSVVDGLGTRMYEGDGQAEVTAGQVEQVTIALQPLPGGLVVTVDLGEDCIYVQGSDECLADADRYGQVSIMPGPDGKPIQHNFNWEAGVARAVLPRARLQPGMYTFHVLFFKDKRIDSNLIFWGQETDVEIRPGHDTNVVWHAETGTLHIGFVVAEP